MSALYEVRNLSKRYDRGEQQVSALKSINLDIERGQFVAIMGPSGSGKSTLLHLLGGLDRPTDGVVKIQGQNILSLSDHELSVFRRRNLGFIFQFFNLLPTLSAIENVALPKLLDHVPLREVEPQAKALLDRMGLGHRMNHKPDQLSGGEMQRVAIARALIANPSVLLADEPTGNLDTKTGESVLELLAQMVKETQKSIIMVTHDPKAASFGNRLIRLRDGVVESDELKG